MKKILNIGFTLALLASGYLIYVNRFDLVDWYKLRNYQPSSLVANLADEASFNDYGERLFYVNDPQLLDKQNFNTKCPVKESGKILGCINFQGIFILDITEPKLESVEVVTSAHEMLHEAYRRLSSSEKENLKQYLDEVYNNPDNEFLQEKIALYELEDEDHFYDELYAFVGTSVEDIPGELEEHYRKYFNDRKSVVELDHSTNQIFEDLEQKANSLEKKIEKLQSEIDALDTQLKQDQAQLMAEKQQLDQDRENLNSDNYEEYNQRARAFNQRVSQYNSDVQYFNGLITQLKDLIDQYNNVQITTKYYDDSLNSKVKL